MDSGKSGRSIDGHRDKRQWNGAMIMKQTGNIFVVSRILKNGCRKSMAREGNNCETRRKSKNDSRF